MTGRGATEMTPAGGLARHVPVLLDEVIAAIAPEAGDRIIDATFGQGGYTRGFLAAAECHVLGIDRDPDAHGAAEHLSSEAGERFTFRAGRFSQLADIAAEVGFVPADAIAFDIGVSSVQLDTAERGFSFQADGPLDMRMAQEGEAAADVINSADEALLADIFYHYGEERGARRIAKRIVARRAAAPFERTGDLASLIADVLGRRPDGKHPATRAFQGLRIFINRELDELVDGLGAAEQILKPGGRLAIVSFHSLEDRIVKRFFDDRSGRSAATSRHAPQLTGPVPTFRLATRGVRKPSDAETRRNPRARSARLRSAIRTDAPARPVDRASVLPAFEVSAARGRGA
ncbi:MAG: 16S rRNA (cytosine(1402)-N(4))-methyltransferase RsmH [Pseudomonadota bacterium]